MICSQDGGTLGTPQGQILALGLAYLPFLLRASSDNDQAPSNAMARRPRSMQKSVRPSCIVDQKPCLPRTATFVVAIATAMSMSKGIVREAMMSPPSRNVIEQRHEAEVHMELLMAMEQG